MNRTPPEAFGMEDPLYYLASSSEEGENVHLVHIEGKGSMTHCVRLMMQSVPVYGIIYSGANITTMGGRLFKKVALVAKLRKRFQEV